MTPVTSSFKREMIEAMLSQGLIQIFVDATKPGVDLPSVLLTEHCVVLNLSKKFGMPMDTLEDGIHAELSFNKVSTHTRIPWHSIWSVKNQDGRAYLFVDVMPSTLTGIVDHSKKLNSLQGGGETTALRTGHLRLLN